MLPYTMYGNEEEDACMSLATMRRCSSYEEEDACMSLATMRHCSSYEEEDACMSLCTMRQSAAYVWQSLMFPYICMAITHVSQSTKVENIGSSLPTCMRRFHVIQSSKVQSCSGY
jgi:hypothetical protein